MKNALVVILIHVILVQISFAQSKPPKDPLEDSIAFYQNIRKFDRVVLFAELWMENVKKQKGEESVEYGAALITLGSAKMRSGKSQNVEAMLQQGLNIQRKAVGDYHQSVAAAYYSLGHYYFHTGNFIKADSLYSKMLDINKSVPFTQHPFPEEVYNNIALVNMQAGNYSRAEAFYLKAEEYGKKRLPEDDPFFAMFLYNNLGILYSETGNFQKAELYLLKALESKKKILKENHPELGRAYNNLANVYVQLGNRSKAVPLHLKGLEIRKKALGEKHPDVAESIQNVASIYSEQGLYAKSIELALEALQIYLVDTVINKMNIANSYNTLGELYNQMGDFAIAETMFLKVINLWKREDWELGPVVAFTYQYLGDMYMKVGRKVTSDSCFNKSMSIRKKMVSEDHPDLGNLNLLLGVSNWAYGSLPKAEPFMFRAWKNQHAQIQRYFPFLSDNEKENFLAQLTKDFDNLKAFCVSREKSRPEVTGDLYDHQLATKALLLSSSAKWKHRIKTAGDVKLNRHFDEWTVNQNRLSKLLQSTDSTERAGIDTIRTKTEKMEKELSLRSENFARLAERKPNTWLQVQKTLKPGEAAIEIIRTRKFGIEKTVTDTSDPKKPIYKIKGLTDTIQYAFLIVKPESKFPEMVLLKNGNDLEGNSFKRYQNAIKRKVAESDSYIQFWEKIGVKLGTVKTIYISPDGVYNNLNINTLLNPKTKKYLLEEKDIRMVTVTKDLIHQQKPEENNKLANLVGFPSYYKTSSIQAVASSERKSPELLYNLDIGLSENLAELPGTKEEVEKIAQFLIAKGWEVQNFTGGKALEESIKESYKPRLLHIATHGFFQPDTTPGNNPLLRSGLMLTGAGSTLKGYKSDQSEDGILTAYEAMNLNLDNTDLVVLSACETGLGEIKNGEGVYGLQRAFKVAGAKSIIMSLWKVDDAATQELMVSFYKHWLSATNGSKRQAFLKAQKELKAKYPNPYYWGAFVMVGE